ncbi:MAG: hypothetical protein MRERV_40c001, partial [Mycoplasmataceae bacterium RV_VA103A]
MSERKLVKGTYYSCQHQQLSSSKCNTCDTERERERERERESNLKQEREIKWKRYQELYNKKEQDRWNFPEQEEQELLKIEAWSREKLGGEYWSDGLVCGSINNDPIMTNTTSLPCQGNCGKFGMVIIKSNANANDRREKYEIKHDCYQHDNTHYTCANCYEKKGNNNSKPTIPNSIREYFHQNNIEELKLENNNWIITYKDKTKKTVST